MPDTTTELAAALDAYVAALLVPDVHTGMEAKDGARFKAWTQCRMLGATWNDYARARRRAEQAAA